MFFSSYTNQFSAEVLSSLIFKYVVVYFSQINQIHCSTLITSLVGVKIKCYLTFSFVQNNFISFLEIIAFRRVRINIFSVQNIRKLDEQILLFTLPPTELVKWI
jgi:hypothetical protein